MRPLWAQTAAGALVVAATAGVVVLPGRLLGSERSTELSLPNAPKPFVIQAHTVHLPVRKPRRTITPLVARTPVQAAAHKTVDTSSVVHRRTAPRHVAQPKLVRVTAPAKPVTTPVTTTPTPAPAQPTVTTSASVPVVDAAKPPVDGVVAAASTAQAQKQLAKSTHQNSGKGKGEQKKGPSQLAAPQQQQAAPQQSAVPDSQRQPPSPPEHGDGRGDASPHGHGHHK